MRSKTWKQILFPVFSLFLLFRSIELMKDLISSEPTDYDNLEMLIISFLLCLFVTGFFAFIGFAYPSSKLLSNSYYEVKNPKFLNFISKIFGIRYFKLLLLMAFWGRASNRRKYFDGTRMGIKNFLFQTKQSEFGHLGAFIVISILSIILIFDGYVYLVFAITLINVIGNLYPVVLQRLHRARVKQIAAIQ